GGVIPVGGNVTIRCRHQHLGMRFQLYKAGVGNYLTYTDPAGSEAEFPITSARREHDGSNTCHYTYRAGRAAYSEPKSSYPKPSISLSPSRRVSLGGAVTVRCRGQRLGVRIVLNKEGRHFPPVDSDGFEAVFPINNHGGSYSCSYRLRSEPFVSSQPSDPVQLVVAGERPSSTVVALGESVTIRCEGRYPGMEFFLRKAGHPNPQVQTVPDGTVAEFPIASVSREDGGSYTCDYRSITDQSRSSYLSDPVEIIVAGEGPGSVARLPGPHPAGHSGAVTVRCRGQHRGVRFMLNKERHHFPPVDSDGFEAVFPISNVRREHSGSYSCSYHSRSEPFAVSYPSDPVELVVRDPSLPRPSISLSPTGVTAPGADVTIRCQGQRRDVRFFLHKAADLNPQRHMDPAGDGAEFRIPTVGRHGGNYSCSYRLQSQPFISSQPSNPVELVVGGEGPGSTSPLPAGPSKLRHPNGMLRARLCPEP
uniref:Ig-like domain-containing protein n=1 Tax=Chrysemys picta bellii TaxID=8478 RepID=A0A8C3HUA0_CHRPI